MREQESVLRNVADAAALRWKAKPAGRIEPSLAIDPDEPSRRRAEAGDRFQECRLAGARGAEDSQRALLGLPTNRQSESIQGKRDVEHGPAHHEARPRLCRRISTVQIAANARTTVSATRASASRSWPICMSLKIARARVCVLPGMLPATMIVAPNSPSALLNPRTAAARRPRRASGSVISMKVLTGPRPSVRATPSRRRSTSSKATLAVRATRGKAMTDEASAAPFHVNRTSRSKPRISSPSGPLRARRTSNRYPTAVGGRTSGSDASVSTNVLPRNSPRARSRPNRIPGGRITAVAQNATFKLISNATKEAELNGAGPAP